MQRRRSSKKTRSFGESSRSSTTTGVRPQYKECLRPFSSEVPQTEEQVSSQHADTRHRKTGRHRGEYRPSEPSLSTSPSPTSPGPSISSHQLPPATNKYLQGHSANADVEAGRFGAVQEVSIAVIGAPTVGKSTFVQYALDLKQASTSPVSSKKVSLEGAIAIIRLFELDLRDVEVTPEQRLRWPEKVGNEITPGIDGVLAIYNVMDNTSISPMPILLSKLLKSLGLFFTA